MDVPVVVISAALAHSTDKHMSEQDDEDLRLRDRLAAAALPALIHRYNDKVGTKWIEAGAPTEAFYADADNIARMAYKIADAMRKARLQAFT